MSTLHRGLFVVLAFLFLLTACSPADIPAPIEAAENSSEPAAGGEVTVSQAGPGEIVITGEQTITYTPVAGVVSYIGGQYEIFLQLESDSAFPLGVRIFVPEGIQPGSYPIVSLITLEDGVTARFDNFAAGALDYFESTDGSIDLTETGDSYSGDFTFNAVDPRDPTRAISVSGNFTGATVQ
jgi:hypothetical protein